jgi:hypothetical protein
MNHRIFVETKRAKVVLLRMTCCCAGQIDQSAHRRLIRATYLQIHTRTGGLANQRWSAQIAHDGQSESRSNTLAPTHSLMQMDNGNFAFQ